MKKSIAVAFTSALFSLFFLFAGKIVAQESAEDPLEAAVARNDTAAVLKLVEKAPGGIKWKDEFGNTFLHMTVGSPAVLEALLKLKPDLEAPNKSGNKPLHFAVKAGAVKSLQALVAAGADINARGEGSEPSKDGTGDTAMICVACIKDPAAMKDAADFIYGKAPGQLNAKGFGGYTPLMHAADRGNLEFAKWLIGKGADKTVKNDNGKTAADSAKGRLALIKENNEQPTQDDLEMGALLVK